ncbi:hypothetical protein CVT26_001198 [Gymnopilus dilepis]|uniref:Uncharacterized protein n=1 Tax=Gymnopilus dilepis TaxID=231916 RepID=A0A409YUG3_9AGAR|nr:hypothetical protein CVT26_001198 [Gymnopilus dilepis]
MGRTAYDFDTYAHKDLRRYIKNFVLPKPPLGQVNPFSPLKPSNVKADVLNGKSHENEGLCVRHEERRVLEKITPFKTSDLDIKRWLDSNIPAKPYKNLAKDHRYNLPTVLSDLWVNVQSEIESMAPWLCLPLVTATRVVHSVYSAQTTAAFSRQHIPPSDPLYDKHDSSRFRYFTWASEGEEDPDDRHASLIVAYQTPYTLSYSDMQAFVSCKSFPAFDESTKDILSAKYRLWGKVWDTCRAWKSNFFVLTNYTHWVFGFFSEGGREAFVSEIVGYNSSSLTILELLTYWVVSSLNIEGTLNRPRVYEPIDADVDMEVASNEMIPRAPRSESAWPGQNEEPGQSAVEDLDTLLSGEGSARDRREMQAQVQDWLQTCRQAQHRRLDEDDLQAPIMPEFELELLEFIPNQPLGEWMVVS